MSIVKHILQEELDRLNELLSLYEKQLKNLPRGSLSKKVRDGKNYFYEAYREGKKVRFKYIGKESSEPVKKILPSYKRRMKYRHLYKEVKGDIDEIQRALDATKR